MLIISERGVFQPIIPAFIKLLAISLSHNALLCMHHPIPMSLGALIPLMTSHASYHHLIHKPFHFSPLLNLLQMHTLPHKMVHVYFCFNYMDVTMVGCRL